MSSEDGREAQSLLSNDSEMMVRGNVSAARAVVGPIESR